MKCKTCNHDTEVRVYTCGTFTIAEKIVESLNYWIGLDKARIEIDSGKRENYYKIMVDMDKWTLAVDKNWMEGFCYGIEYGILHA